MSSPPLPKFLVVAVVLACACPSVFAAPGDVFVPAHRTRDGSYVPANVAPLSGGNHLARRPARARAVTRKAAAPSRPATVSPLFVEARPIRR